MEQNAFREEVATRKKVSSPERRDQRLLPFDYAGSLSVPAVPKWKAPDGLPSHLPQLMIKRYCFVTYEFAGWFGDMEVGPLPAEELPVWRHGRAGKLSAWDIFDEMGESSAIELSQFFLIHDWHLDGKTVPLLDLSGRHPNIAHIRDKHGVIRSVHSRWNEPRQRWNIHAYDLDTDRRQNIKWLDRAAVIAGGV